MKIQDLTILISDDSTLARKQLKDVLTSVGCSHFIEASNGEEAIELYKTQHPDILFLDIVMPKIDGIEVIRQVTAIDAHADIIIVSSVGTKAQLKAAIEAGAKDFVQKPFNPTQIQDIINTRIEGR